MPPLLCPSPTLVDHSFPRDTEELRRVATAYGELQEIVGRDHARILLTEVLVQFAEMFEWENPNGHILLRDIYNLINQWLLQPSESISIVDLRDIMGHSRHPIPLGCSNQGLVEDWADEVGRVLLCHDQHCTAGYCIGIACERALSGETVGTYCDQAAGRAFPLVGPDELARLEDAFEWDIPSYIHRKRVSFALAYKNVKILGASKIDPPSGGSHFKVHFPNNRPWPLDRNHCIIPDKYVAELVDITGLPLNVVKTVLIEGRMPEVVSRIRRFRGR